MKYEYKKVKTLFTHIKEKISKAGAEDWAKSFLNKWGKKDFKVSSTKYLEYLSSEDKKKIWPSGTR